MHASNIIASFELIYVIVNCGMGSKILHRAKHFGIPGGTVIIAKGTVKSHWLNLFSLYDERKEMVILGADYTTAEFVLDKLNKEFQFEKPHHGIAFTVSTCEILGSRGCRCRDVEETGGISEIMYQIIIAIVNRGLAEELIEAAQAAGAKGGTIVNARGSGINETSKLFNMEIEPEKEIVMILTKESSTDAIVQSIREKLEIDKPGKGVIFIQNVNKVYGVYE